MTHVLIAYSTVDGQTRRICERLQEHLLRAGHTASLQALGETPAAAVSGCGSIVIGASVRYGHYRREVFDFVARCRQRLDTKPSAFFSVNVVARKQGKDSPLTNPYVSAFLRKTGWTPALMAVFAGRIEYPKYRFFDRQIIRLIMWLTGGPTDPTASVEFTDWNAVESFGNQLAGLLNAPAGGERRAPSP